MSRRYSFVETPSKHSVKIEPNIKGERKEPNYIKFVTKLDS